MKNVLPAQVLSHLRTIAAEEMCEDSLDFLEEVDGLCGYTFDEEGLFHLREAVLRPFRFVRGFHGCRPASLETYLRDGLLTLTRPRLADMAFELFEGSVTKDELARRAAGANLETRLGCIRFLAVQDPLIERCGHYLIYGAEALCCLWKHPNQEDPRRFHESQDRARQRGIPTILTCDVPITVLGVDSRQGLADSLITRYLQIKSVKPIEPDDWDMNYTFVIEQDLPAACIRDHSHPQHIRDPLRTGVIYESPNATCDWCGVRKGCHLPKQSAS